MVKEQQRNDSVDFLGRAVLQTKCMLTGGHNWFVTPAGCMCTKCYTFMTRTDFEIKFKGKVKKITDVLT